MKRLLTGLMFVAAGLIAAAPAWAQKTVTFAYQDMMNPWRWVQQSQEIEKATGFKINWRQFGGGGDVIRAMASGDVQLGEVGSTGVATAISQGMDVDLFWILEDIAAAEALVARNGSGINTIADLKGKKIGTPFVSTSHFQLLYAMQQAGNRRRLGPRRHRRDVHLGSGALQRQEERQGAHDVGRHLQEGRMHLRRAHRDQEVRQGESGIHGGAGQGGGQGRC